MTPPPQGRVGFKRQWVNEPGRLPYWHFFPVDRPHNWEIIEALRFQDEEWDFDAYANSRQGQERLFDHIWDDYHEKWFPATPVENEIYRAYHNNDESDFNEQVQQRDNDYASYLYRVMNVRQY